MGAIFLSLAGYHDGVARPFVEGFNGRKVIVGGISFQVIEELIVDS